MFALHISPATAIQDNFVNIFNRPLLQEFEASYAPDTMLPSKHRLSSLARYLQRLEWRQPLVMYETT